MRQHTKFQRSRSMRGWVINDLVLFSGGGGEIVAFIFSEMKYQAPASNNANSA